MTSESRTFNFLDVIADDSLLPSIMEECARSTKLLEKNLSLGGCCVFRFIWYFLLSH